MNKTDGVVFEIEEDMKPRKFEETDKKASIAFCKYPLIGDALISEALLEKWIIKTREYIEKKLENRSILFHDWVYDMVSLVIVKFAKDWNSNEESRFTNYVTMKLGYRDDSGRIWGIICDALEIAFKQHNRFFVKRHKERQFYETVMVHSLGPNGAWNPLLDLLFDFYVANLDWTYIPGDPIFSRLVYALQGILNCSDADDDQYVIVSKRYNLKVGIRRIILERPGYCAHLFEMIVKRIHLLFNSDVEKARRYRNQLIDRWFSEKISSSSAIKEKKRHEIRYSPDIALDYSRVNIRYTIIDCKVAIQIPFIRILEDDKGFAVAELYDDNRLIKRFDLDIGGNELGETIKQKTIIFPIELFAGNELRCRLVIKHGKTIIYDSGKRLWRQLIFFSGEKEINVNSITKEKYDVFVPKYNMLKGENIDLIPVNNGLCEISLHKNYVLEYAGNTISIDTSDIKGIRITEPVGFDNARFLLDGEEYQLLKMNTSLKVYYENREEAIKYRVIINGINKSLADYYDSDANNRSVISFEKESKKTEISIVDVAAGIVVFKKEYYIIPDLKITFNERTYITDEEYEKLSVSITCNGESVRLHADNHNEICYGYDEGMIIVDIPYIHYGYSGITTLFFEKYIRREDISNNAELYIDNKSGIKYNVIIGEKELGDISNVSLADYVSDSNGDGDQLNIILSVDGKNYEIGHIISKDMFVNEPSISLFENALIWDGGSSFVGDAESSLELTLMKNNQVKYCYHLKLGNQIIHQFIKNEFVDDKYECVFSSNDVPIFKCQYNIGNESKIRFSEKKIIIDRVTEDIEGFSRPIEIKTVYIDQIKYIDTCYVPSEGDIYDVYSGCMYWVDWNGDKRYYSFRYDDKKSKYKLNPVKIICISDKYLRIVTEGDEEGLLYHYHSNAYDSGYEITDRNLNTKDVKDILFFLYKTENIINKQSILKIESKKTINNANGIISVEKKAEEKKKILANSSLRCLKTVTQETVINESVNARILVNAGPGTGKTWALIERIIHLVNTGTEPENIQVLCFSRAAVEVIRKRMADASSSGRVDSIINLVDIRTFDSFATQLLYWVKDSDYSEVGKEFKIEGLNYEERIDRFIRVLKAQPGLIEQCEHFIVDEVQDLVLNRAKMVLEMIRLIPGKCGVTLFGDACQAIYDYQVETGISSDDFYEAIESLKQFSYYSFDHNYRSSSHLQKYCDDYRKAILDRDSYGCQEVISILRDVLPEYDTVNIKKFNEDSLERLLKTGNVGILTRSNAQALYLSGLFYRKNILHVLQRRLSDNYLNGWIAVFFNSLKEKYYDEDSFSKCFCDMFKMGYSTKDAEDIWNTISSFSKESNGIVSVSDLLHGIRDCGKSELIYLDNRESQVTISTIHRSKGKEYDYVIVLDDLISDNPDSMEEQRVNYVALSRAKKQLYKVEMPKLYFRSLNNRRCYYSDKNFMSGKYNLSLFEIGRPGDFYSNSFCTKDGIQKFLRENCYRLKGSEIYLEREYAYINDYITYRIILKENGMVIGETSQSFAEDLESALRTVKHLPWHAKVHDYVFPKRFSDIFITDVASEIGLLQGDEKGIREFDSFGTWNIVLAAGYARVEY